MKKIRTFFNQWYRSEGWRWLMAALLTCCVFAAVLYFQTITYYDNDDTNIMFALAGYRSGTPFMTHPFINCMLGFLVSSMYRLFPALPWWTVFHLVTLFAAITITGMCLLKICAKKNVSLLIPLAVFAVLGMGLYFYPTALLMFTVTAAAIGTAGIALVLAFDFSDGKGTKILYAVLAVVCMFFAFLFRNSSGIGLLPFFFLALLYRFLTAGGDEKKKKRIQIAVVCGICAVVFISTVSINTLGNETLHADAFYDFEQQRSTFIDYPHDAYGKNPALYASVGWDETLYGLANNWFLLDERINTETLSILNTQSQTSSNTIDQLPRFFKSYPLAAYGVGMALAALVAAVFAFLSNRKSILTLLASLCTFLGAVAMMLLMFWMGRYALRVHMMLFLPTTVMLVLLGFLTLDQDRSKGKLRRPFSFVLIAFASGAAVIGAFCGYKIFRTTISYESEQMLSDSQYMVEYVIAHPDNLYIRDTHVANNVDALTTYPDEKPVNLMDWGGCERYTGAQQAQLAVLGIGEPYADLFLQDNVFYIGNDQDIYKGLLDAYMQKEYGCSGMEQVDYLGNDVYIYRFVGGSKG